MTTGTDAGTDVLNRRSYLLATACVAGSLGGVSTGLAGEGSSAGVPADGRPDVPDGRISPSWFVLEQGETCLPLGVVTSDENLPVEEFYDYRSSDTDPTGWYSSYGPARALERNGNSVLYLYDGPRGTSLVFMHGMRGGESGGAVTLRFSGVPAEGEWAVTDDRYNASTNYDGFERTEDGWTVDWTWATDPDNGGGADGGAFRGVTRDDEIRIDPAFNEEARLYGQHYEGEVEGWNALVADGDGPRWASLDLDRPVVVRYGACDGGRRGTTTFPGNTGTTTTDGLADGPTAARTTASDGQDGFGAAAALCCVLGVGLRLLRRRGAE